MRCLCKHPCHPEGARCTATACGCVICVCFDCERARIGELPEKPETDFVNEHVISLEVTDIQLKDLIKEQAKREVYVPLCVLFYSSESASSRAFWPEYEKAALTLGFSDTNKVKYKAAFGRVDYEENPSVRETYDLKGFPTVILFGRHGEVARWRGRTTSEKLCARIHDLMKAGKA